MSKSEGPVFEKRPDKDRYQVRFWSSPELYESFGHAVDEAGLIRQDVFNDFMVWFVNASLDKKLQVRSVNEQE